MMYDLEVEWEWMGFEVRWMNVKKEIEWIGQ